MDLFEELLAVTRALDGAGVDYALVGGLAVSVWGAPRATKDIDLLVLPQEVEAAKAALRGCGYGLEAFPFEFQDGMTVHRQNKVHGQALLTVDLLLVDGNTEAIWQTRRALAVEGGELKVVSRDALIRMKLAAGRPQDQADVVKLQEQDR